MSESHGTSGFTGKAASRGHQRRLVAAAAVALISQSFAYAGERIEPTADPAIKGSLVIIGGSARRDNDELWGELLKLAGGPGSKIAVIPAASSFPEKNGKRAVDILNATGAEAFFVPVAPTGLDMDCQTAVHDPQLVEQVRQATGVFFIGGAQARIRQALVAANGQNSPMLDAIWDVYRRGGVVAGTSAGAAIMSRVMFREAGVVLATMLNGVQMGKEVDHGLGFLDPDWFVDQHCLVRGRFARALVAMQSQNVKLGIGIDEDTALVVRNGNAAQVIGYRGAVVMDLTNATNDTNVEGFNLRNAKLSYLNRGDKLDLETLVVTPAPQKLADRKIDPSAPDFKPFSGRRIFFSDILANTALTDVMRRIIDHKDGQAIGLAFDGVAALSGTTPGFEFRFYRDKDSIGWETEAFGSGDYTIQNIHLDIRPIQIKGPLYDDPPASATNPPATVAGLPMSK